MTENTNPLGKYYRQPQVYIKLPSKGKYYPADVFTPTETGEIPVLPMTAKDELAFKTPDAMMNGQATVDVIKSCIPNLKNPWKMVNYDTDTILLAIRIATYGETMDIAYAVPTINESQSTTVNLPALLDGVSGIEPKDYATTKSGFKIKIDPLTYDKLSKIQVAQFEQQKIYSNVAESGLSESQKSERFATSYRKMQDINIELLIDSIAEITTPDNTVVTDGKQIFDFIANVDTKVTREIELVLGDLRSQCSMKPIQLKATEEQIKKGAPASYEVPVTFDTANFFRIALLSKSDSDIVKYLKEYDSACKNLKLEILKICWFMRGGMSWQEALELSPDERQIVSQLVKDNMETTKKSGQPFF